MDFVGRRYFDLFQGNTFQAAEYLVGTRQVQRLLAVYVSFVSLLVFRELSYHRTRMRFPTHIRRQLSSAYCSFGRRSVS